MNKTTYATALLTLLSTLVIGCGALGPQYSIVSRSGQPLTQSPMGVTFDYSEAVFRDGVREQTWLAQLNPDEVERYHAARALLEQNFITSLSDHAGVQAVAATGSEPIVATVVVRQFELGRFIPFANIETFIQANVRFTRGGETTDEILVGASGGVPMGGYQQTITVAGFNLGVFTSEFMLSPP